MADSPISDAEAERILTALVQSNGSEVDLTVDEATAFADLTVDEVIRHAWNAGALEVPDAILAWLTVVNHIDTVPLLHIRVRTGPNLSFGAFGDARTFDVNAVAG